MSYSTFRMQDHSERDTPDSFVPSSSPESVVGMEVSRYPDLSLVKEEPPEPVPSPIIPILPSNVGKGGQMLSFYNSLLISLMLTLNPLPLVFFLF